MSFKVIKPEEIERSAFELINKDWMLLTSGDAESYNTMTVSWGGLGVIWHKPAATIYVRPQRYTYEFMEKNEYFTLSVYPDAMRDKLTICGKKSGRDIDKAKECGFTAAQSSCGSVYFEEAELVLVCKKKFHSDFTPANFDDASLEEFYPNHDYHRMYIGEIVEVLKKS